MNKIYCDIKVQNNSFANKFENFTSKLIEINEFFHNYVIFDFCQTTLLIYMLLFNNCVHNL
jgi:hypothetical protein